MELSISLSFSVIISDFRDTKMTRRSGVAMVTRVITDFHESARVCAVSLEQLTMLTGRYPQGSVQLPGSDTAPLARCFRRVTTANRSAADTLTGSAPDSRTPT